MDKGIKFILCIIAIILTIIAERGTPVKFKKWDILTYGFVFILLLFLSGYLSV
jgi:multisubunit Na+/H+ antiporter MnhB subunit